ncbi:hypothetical protein ACHELZ_002374 [Vibrio vulnificus]
MDILTFISELVGVVAWPIVVLILGLFYRTSIAGLLPSLSKIKAGPVEAEFDVEMRTTLAKSKEIVAHAVPEVKQGFSSEEQEVSSTLAKIYIDEQSPKNMILDGWRSIDGALWRIGKDAGVIVDPMDSIKGVYRSVLSKDILTSETKKLVIELYEIRNRIVEANIIPSLNAARDYILTVEQTVKLIDDQRKKGVEKIGDATF